MMADSLQAHVTLFEHPLL